MLNCTNKLLISVAFIILLIEGQSYLPIFRLEMPQDSIYIEEPMVLKCWLVNDNDVPVKVWDEGPVGLLYTGGIDFYLTSAVKDTFRYAVGIDDFTRRMPSLEIKAHDSIYWYSLLGWHNFIRTPIRNVFPGQFKIFSRYNLTVKNAMTDSFSFPVIQSNEISFTAIGIPDSEQTIYDEWIPLTHEYFWWGERFENRWVRPDYNELCKRVAESKSRFARYAHYIYCKSTGDKKEMQKFLKRYPSGPLSELIEFMRNPDEARKKYPCNTWPK